MALSHVTVSYKDDEEDDDKSQQRASLLPTNRTTSPSRGSGWQEYRPRRGCTRTRWIVLYLAILVIFIGGVGIAFHGMESEALQAARKKVTELEGSLGQQFRGGYNKFLAAIKRPSSTSFQDYVDSPHGNTTDSTKTALSKVDALKSNSVIVLKTGASVLFDRLPVQLLQAQTAFHPDVHLTGQPGYHGPSLFVYSDSDVQLGPFAVHDALANVSTYVRNLPDFSDRYTKLHQLLSSGHLKAESFGEGWNLDKWKFLYMWQDAFHRNPTADWYIGYEADTFVLWESLFKFLTTQDATKEQLFGCGSILIARHELFANGGCPYVISGALMRATYGKDPEFASKFDSLVKGSCCGDAELSIALRKSATKEIKDLGEAGARFQGERPREIVFNGYNWCQPVFSFHHLKAEEVQWLSQIERDIRSNKTDKETVLYSDIFDHILPDKLSQALLSISKGSDASGSVDLTPTQEHWEAFSSSDEGVTAHGRTEEAAACKRMCIEGEGCTTWFWLKVTDSDRDGDCFLMKGVVRIGKAYEGLGSRTSGWVANRIASFKADHHCQNAPEA